MQRKRQSELSDIERRLARASGPLAAELRRRGIASRRESGSTHHPPRLTGVLLAAELANADRKLSARTVLRGLLSREELKALQVMLKLQPYTGRDIRLCELGRIVDRELEGKRHGNGR